MTEAEEIEQIEQIARVLAQDGFGRPWDDFAEVDAFDTGQSDLLEWARAILPLITSAHDKGAESMRERATNRVHAFRGSGASDLRSVAHAIAALPLKATP